MTWIIYLLLRVANGAGLIPRPRPRPKVGTTHHASAPPRDHHTHRGYVPPWAEPLDR